MPPRWRRPYRPGPIRLAALAFLLLGAALLGLLAVEVVAAVIATAAVLPVVLALTFVLLWTGSAWRFFAVGVYVSEDGVRVRNFTRTTTLKWNEVRRIYLAPLTLPGIGAGRTGAKSLWIDSIDGPPIQSTILNSQSAEFLGRPRAFQRAVDSIIAQRPENSA